METNKDIIAQKEKRISQIEGFCKNFDADVYRRQLELKIDEPYDCTWEQVCEFAKQLAHEVVEKGYVGVYGVPRAGCVIATIVSFYANCPILAAPCKNCLIVEDTSNTGNSLVPYFNKYDVAVMFTNRSPFKPTYVYKDIPDVWVRMPWER